MTSFALIFSEVAIISLAQFKFSIQRCTKPVQDHV